MNRGRFFLTAALLAALTGGVYALSGDGEAAAGFVPLGIYAQAAPADTVEVPGGIRNNKYFLESVRLTRLAQDSYEEGDYDASTDYAAEALRLARLSDEYVARQLKIREASAAIAAARGRLEWARSVGVHSRYPEEYSIADTEYGNARAAQGMEDWDGAIAAARRVLAALAGVEAAPPLPAQYTIRPWNLSKDCLWNIAARPWAYGDPEQWRLLYNANRAKLPNPDNPNLIEPGMTLDIPSIRGEIRQGLWEANQTYPPLP